MNVIVRVNNKEETRVAPSRVALKAEILQRLVGVVYGKCVE